MIHSDAINELAAALAAARVEFKPFAKDQTAKVQAKSGANYEYKYADLAALFEATTPALSKHGLALSQWPSINSGGRFVLVTLLTHASGQWLAAEYPLGTYDRPQEQGSAITYAKRYAASSALGIAAEADDDGALAQQSKDRQAEQPQYRVTAPRRIALPAGTVQIVDVQPQRKGGAEWAVATFLDDQGEEHTLPTPADGTGAALALLTQLAEEAIPVTIETAITPRSKKTVIKAAHRWPPQPVVEDTPPPAITADEIPF